ncbi:hypothetical protein V8G54_032527 [Vigna mungo]|uniref:Ty3/gypsy retrotransposon protein n=1 Tax=Vigna mungo TaxID=3915 RepID=A0AAQ3MML3_VIGMU
MANRPTNAERLDDLTLKVDSIMEQLSLLMVRPPSSPPRVSPSPSHAPDGLRRPHLKLEVPRFDGTDPIGWIFKISQFFEYHSTPEPERLQVASFYMDGPALSWYQWMYRNNQIQSWFGFLHALETRFTPSLYDEPSGALFKLTQKGTVQQYLTEFERLANRIVGLPAPFALNCFISGLTPEIRREVQALRPASLDHATQLAKLQEDKIEERRPATAPPALLPAPQPRINFRRLSPEDMAARREKGLCYNCDEIFTPSHRCKGKFFLFTTEDPIADDFTPDRPLILDPPSPAPVADGRPSQVSLHAFTGGVGSSTIRLQGQIGNNPVSILVDGGSDHNFIQDRVAKFLDLPSIPYNPLTVMVGSDNLLRCDHLCPEVEIKIQEHTLTVNFYILPLRGADIVLGAPWLKSIGPVLMDYTQLRISFNHQDQPILLRGINHSYTDPISSPQLKRCLQTNNASELFAIQIIPIHEPTPTISPLPTTSSLPPDITDLLLRFDHIFQSPPSLPPSRPTDHRIHLIPNSTPVNVKPYRYPHSQKCELEKQVKELLDKAMIQPSRSPFSSPVLLVRKKDGSWRCCIDYRALNVVTVRDRFPMPTIDELLDELSGATWFSKLDLRQGFHQILMHPDDIAKTAFRTHQGHYEYRVMPFGLCNAPSTFQATMNNLLGAFLRRFVVVFFDDILVYSSSLSRHVSHLEQVFQCLLENKFYLKLSKCLFAQKQLEYLGHIISAAGVQPDPSKIQAVLAWPPPSNVKTLWGFLGLTGFYRKFVKGYATIASPLTSLLRKDAFDWTSEAQHAFDDLKAAMTRAPVLALPDFSVPFIVDTDASGTAMGAVLMQRNQPIAFFSKPFSPKLLHSSTYVRELHAITSAVKKWRQYLLGYPFVINTDHKSLKEILSQVIQTPEQQYYLSKLLGYEYTIQYKPGSHNVVADGLSRLPDSSGMCYTLSMPNFIFLEQLRQSVETSSAYATLLSRIQTDPDAHPDYTLHNGLILFKNRLWLNPDNTFRLKLIDEYHSTPIGGHMGITKTVTRLLANFYWDGLRKDVKIFIRQCSICQQVKSGTHKPAGLLQPLPVPTAIWEDLSLDFITGLPASQGFTVILVVVDRFSKGVHLGPLPQHYSASMVAHLFLDISYKYHGIPRSIVSDRDPIFISKFWRELFRLYGTRLRMSTSYHPETDGQTEVFNRVLEQYLRSFVHSNPSQWSKHLALAEWSYNTSTHSSTGYSPFNIIYGKPAPSIPHYLVGSSSVEAVDTRKLLKAQATMKHYADLKRRDMSYEVGDLVYVRLRPYRQQSLSGLSYHKLSKRFYGPYKVLARIGTVAYQLDLPPESKFHPVFHCSLLKRHHGPVPDPTPLPLEAFNQQPLIRPLAILDTRMDTSTDSPTKMVLVQWLGLSPDDTNWEEWEQLRSDYHLEDKVIFPEEDIVSNQTIGQLNNTRPKRTTTTLAHLKDYVP